jgi:hypothetical protein
MSNNDRLPTISHNNNPKPNGRQPTRFNVARDNVLPIKYNVTARPALAIKTKT